MRMPGLPPRHSCGCRVSRNRPVSRPARPILSLEDKMASGKKGPSLHVVPSKTRPGKFVVKEEGNPNPITRPATQSASIDKAVPKAKQNHSEVVIHRRDGTIRDSDSYGNDPNPPKDKKH